MGAGSNVVVFVACLFSVMACKSSKEELPKLKSVFEDQFLIGAALNRNQILKKDTNALRLIGDHFNTITPENVMKWENIHPEPNHYAFEVPDQYAALGEANDMFIVGHTLVWHNQLPEWVIYRNPEMDSEENPSFFVDSLTLMNRIRDHISSVVGHYKGRVDAWDVVNEAINEEGNFRQSPFFKIAGEQYIQKAFEYARDADPEAELYYNDYNLWKPAKRDGVIRLVKKLQANGVRVDGIGMQGHWSLDHPSIEQLEASIKKFAALGVKVMITELDISVLPDPDEVEGPESPDNEDLNPYPEELPDSVQVQLANRYRNLFELFNKHSDKIDRVTCWGVYDGQSWKNNWPVRGRTNYPLLFDRNYEPKKAFYKVVENVKQK